MPRETHSEHICSAVSVSASRFSFWSSFLSVEDIWWLVKDFTHQCWAIAVRKYRASTFRFEKGKPCSSFGENEERHFSCPSICVRSCRRYGLVVAESLDEVLSF